MIEKKLCVGFRRGDEDIEPKEMHCPLEDSDDVGGL